jgi:hypothetical protein
VLLATMDCLLLTAGCVLHSGALELAGLFPRCAVHDKMSSPMGKEETSNFKKWGNNAAMSMKTKGRLSIVQGEAGIL